MKKLGKLKLQNASELKEYEMKMIFGGGYSSSGGRNCSNSCSDDCSEGLRCVNETPDAHKATCKCKSKGGY